MGDPPKPLPDIDWGNLPDAMVAHSYIKHHVVQNDYNKPQLGTPSWNIPDNRSDLLAPDGRAALRSKAVAMLNDPHTRFYINKLADGNSNILVVNDAYGAVVQFSTNKPAEAAFYPPGKPIRAFEKPYLDATNGNSKGPLDAHQFQASMSTDDMKKITKINPDSITAEKNLEIQNFPKTMRDHLERGLAKELARDDRLKPYMEKSAKGELALKKPLPEEARKIIQDEIQTLIDKNPAAYENDPRIKSGKNPSKSVLANIELEMASKINSEQLKIYKSAQRDAPVAPVPAERDNAAPEPKQETTADQEHGTPAKPDPTVHTTGETTPGHTGEGPVVHTGPGGIGSKTTPLEHENGPHGGNGANALMGLGIALQAAGELTGPNKLSTTQKVTLAGQASTGLAQMGLEYASPSFVNLKGGPTNWTGVRNNITGDVTALGRLGGGLGTLGGGLGMYSSGAGFVDAANRHDTVGMVLNGGNFASSTAFAVGGVAQVLGDASLAADSTGVGVIIGVPIQVAGLGFQLYNLHQDSVYMDQLMASRLAQERQQSQGSPSYAYNYIPGLPIKPTFNEYNGLMSLNIELKAQHFTYSDGKTPFNLKDMKDDPAALTRVAQEMGPRYDKGVTERKDGQDDMKSFINSSTLGNFTAWLAGDDYETRDQNLMDQGERDISLGTAGRAAQQELNAGPPNANNSNMVGYAWRVDEYNRRIKPLEGKYDAQIDQLNKLGEVYHGARLRAANPADQDRFVREQARQNIVAERQRVEAMTPAQQDAYFKKNREFVEKAGLKTRTDLGLVALSISREDYNRKTLTFAPAVYADKAAQALSHNLTTLRTLDDQRKIYAGREKQLENLMPGVHPGDMPVTDEKGQPVVKNGKAVTFRDVQNDLAGNIKDAQAQIDGLKKDPKSAADPDMKARIALATVQLQTLQIRCADNENHNLSYKLQIYDKAAASLATGNEKIRQEITAAGLNNVPVTPTAAMQRANQTYVDGLKVIQKESDALTASKKSFDQKFGSPEAQASLLKKGDPAYIAALSKLQAAEFQISADRIKAMQAEHDYLRGFEAEAHKAASPKTSSASNAGSDDVVADGGVRNRDGTAAESGALTTTFTARAEGQTVDPDNDSDPGQAAPAIAKPKSPSAAA